MPTRLMYNARPHVTLSFQAHAFSAARPLPFPPSYTPHRQRYLSCLCRCLRSAVVYPSSSIVVYTSTLISPQSCLLCAVVYFVSSYYTPPSPQRILVFHPRHLSVPSTTSTRSGMGLVDTPRCSMNRSSVSEVAIPHHYHEGPCSTSTADSGDLTTVDP
ncbi:hypothetical protein BDD12DRAFT_16238 [Trichophaea hybrida]|nr:hypothetical protein BDD12DRAFT_16238 [Trichophaea hybrida]